MPQPSPDQVQIAQEVLAGTRQITGSAAAEDTDAKLAEEETRQKALDASVENQAANFGSSYESPANGIDPAPLATTPVPEPEPSPELKVN